MRFFLVVIVILLAIAAYFMVDIRQTQEGRLPSVEVDEGQAPKYEFDLGGFEIVWKKATFSYPTVRFRSPEENGSTPAPEPQIREEAPAPSPAPAPETAPPMNAPSSTEPETTPPASPGRSETMPAPSETSPESPANGSVEPLPVPGDLDTGSDAREPRDRQVEPESSQPDRTNGEPEPAEIINPDVSR
ncbi:hypothetical protein J2R99_000723 [Rhodopseudomonas julia]|uniref:Uncharacterized protein n=1 Tax=Rhodopseudomonas julia TaxID=200617 RepID=A0ABU0C2Y0_9BRAD|nr:hypothetical protein [Rhodopseudomonas julia]MDQ0324874.1 hypothetical protein [Rhodopseudomonas julia]